MPKISEEDREEENLSEVVESLRDNELDFGDTREEFLAAGQRAHEKMNPDRNHGETQISGLQIGEPEESHVEELYPDAADDSIEVYQWGEGEQAETFILEDTHGMEGEDTAYRSRKIVSENAEYHLVQEKVEGDTYIELEVEGEPMFGVNSQSDFEAKWQELKGNDSEIASLSAFDDEYAASSDEHHE